ncbi:MAG: DUF2130 domain-containing protein [Nitrososphaerota archaeon]|jgi:hypothetical protein|nr:DUF2130 domain-containing protein [Nitrososphaerota archaeon]
MPDQSIDCPKCGAKIQLTEALRHQVEEQVREKFEQQYSKKEEAMSSELKKKQQALELRESRIKRSEQSIDERVKKGVGDQLVKMQESAKKEAEEKVAVDLKDKQNQLTELSKEVAKYRDTELRLRKETRALEDRQKTMDLEVERKIDEERKKVDAKARSEESQKWEEKLQAKEEELSRIKKDLERAGKVGDSGELAGEAAERTLEERLRETFEEDEIQPIGRGKAGADVLHTVKLGGSILWESKASYQTWSKEWILKLKRDRDDAKATVAVLVTTVAPEGQNLQAPTFLDGVILTPPWLAVGVASLLRPQLLELARQRRLYDKKESLQAEVFAWVTSQEFQRGITAIAQNLLKLQHEITRAKVNHAKWFKHMEVETERTLISLGEFYGTAKGQARLPDLPVLALNPGDGGSANDVDEGPGDGDGRAERDAVEHEKDE